MDHMDSREFVSDADLEYGDISRGSDQNKGWSCIGQHSKRTVDGEWSVVKGPNGLAKCDDRLNTSKNVLNSGENVEIYVDNVGKEAKSLLKQKVLQEKQKSITLKPPKPPRPPRTPSFDEVDLQLYREISELARLKYVRIQRMKALKKKKRADKASSSLPVFSFFAMAITILFCGVIIFQGILGSNI